MSRHDRPQGPAERGVGTHRNRTSRVSGPDVVRLAEGLLPDVERLTLAATEHLLDQSPQVLRCHHVDTADVVVACVQHPVAGLLCLACAERHVGRHAQELEHLCDRCELQAETMHSVLATKSMVLATIDTAGRRAAYVGPVVLVCLGVCTNCATELDLPTEVVG